MFAGSGMGGLGVLLNGKRMKTELGKRVNKPDDLKFMVVAESGFLLPGDEDQKKEDGSFFDRISKVVQLGVDKDNLPSKCLASLPKICSNDVPDLKPPECVQSSKLDYPIHTECMFPGKCSKEMDTNEVPIFIVESWYNPWQLENARDVGCAEGSSPLMDCNQSDLSKVYDFHNEMSEALGEAFTQSAPPGADSDD